MENTGSNQPRMNDAQRAIFQQRMDNQYKIIQKNLQKRRMSYGMVRPTDLHPVTRSRHARSVPAKLPRTPEQPSGTPEPLPGTPEQLPGTPEQLPGTPEPLPGTPEPPPVPAASPIMEDVASGSDTPDNLDSDSWTTISSSEDSFIAHNVSPASSPESSEDNCIRDYRFLRILGEGHFGKVMLAEHLVTGEQVAIKIIEKPEDPDELSYLYREVNIMKMLDHPNIVKLIDVIDMESYLLLVMEYCSGGNLEDYIQSDHYRGEEDAKIFFRQIVSAVQYCHENNVTHRDLKPENILVVANKNIKITDFGLSNIFTPGETLSSFCGTVYFSAPEVLDREPYDGAQVDIWSLGVILYNLVTDNYPFDGDSTEEFIKAVKRNTFNTPNASKQCRKLIKQMLTLDPSKRATMQEVIQSRWLREEEDSTSRSSASEEVSSEEASTARVPWWKRVRNFFRQCCSCFKEPATSD